jgi:hypothetical protein
MKKLSLSTWMKEKLNCITLVSANVYRFKRSTAVQSVHGQGSLTEGEGSVHLFNLKITSSPVRLLNSGCHKCDCNLLCHLDNLFTLFLLAEKE